MKEQLENIKSRFVALSKEKQVKIISKVNRRIRTEPKDVKDFWLEIESYLQSA